MEAESRLGALHLGWDPGLPTVRVDHQRLGQIITGGLVKGETCG